MVRRALTHARGRGTAVAFVMLLAVAGLYAGVRIERASGGSATGSVRAPAAGGFSARAAGGFGRPSGAAGVSGTVASIDGAVIDVTEVDGPTVAVRLARGATVTKTASQTATAAGVHAGDTVEFAGMSSGGDAIAATSLRDLGHLTAPASATSTSAGSTSAGSATSLFGG